MNKLLKKHSLPFSVGKKEIVDLLIQETKKAKGPDFTKCSPALLQKVKQYEKMLKKHGLPSNLALVRISKEVGHGIFLRNDAKPLKRGTFIGIYTGILDTLPADELDKCSYAYDLIEEFFLKKKPLSIITNAINSGNFTRYINHSSYKPNMEAQSKIMPDGRLEIFLITKRKIKPGEQLLSSYGGGYWKALNIIPSMIAPDTYLLQNNKKAILNKTIQDPYLTKEATRYFLRFREALAIGSLEDEYPPMKKVSAILKDKIDQFDDEVTERGITRNLALCKTAHNKWGVFLKKGSASIAKGAFIGAYGGVFKWVPDGKKYDNAHTYDLFTKKRNGKLSTLKISAKTTGNFTREFTSSFDPNVEARIYLLKDFGPQVLFFAKKRIFPGQILSVKNG